jgi:hypothetical protein
MLKAGALYYTVFISFIISLIIGSLLLYLYFHNQYINSEILHERLTNNIESGINISLAAPEDIPYRKKKIIDLYGDGESIIEIRKEQWGALDVVKVSSSIKKFTKTKIALQGEYIFNTENQALYLCDLKKYLSISGDTRIVGNCSLPKLGIKQVYIQEKGYTGEHLVYGNKSQSKSSLPEINQNLIAFNKVYFEPLEMTKDSIVNAGVVLSEDSIKQSFFDKTIVLYSDNPIDIDYQSITGNIIIVSNHSITVGKNLKSSNIVLYAPQIEVEAGFRGDLQMFAMEKITIGKNCRLNYPSFLGLFDKSSVGDKMIHISEGSNIAGGILFMGENEKNNQLTLARNTNIYGQVFCNGNMELKGSIYGSLYCKKFVLKTKSTYYENHLMDVTIDFTSLNENYTGFDLIEGTDEKRLIRWLY